MENYALIFVVLTCWIDVTGKSKYRTKIAYLLFRVEKLIFTAFLLDAQHKRDSVENKPASLLVVPLGKVLGGIPPS